MAVQLERRLLTLEEYERMIEAGIFNEDERLELIRGDIVKMAPIGLRHTACVARLTMLLARKVGDRAIVWVQNPIRLDDDSEPEPDLALLQPRPDFYSTKRPTHNDIMVVVEVADSSVSYDRNMKVQLYAEAGIRELWLVILPQDIIEIYSTPAEGVYQNVQRLGRGERLALPGKLKGAVEVNDILGEKEK